MIRPSPRWSETLAVVMLCAVVATLTYAAARTLDRGFLDPAIGADVWFEGDLPRVVDELTHRYAPHSRAVVHPVFALVTTLPTYALRAAGLSAESAVALLLALAAAHWTAWLYVALRLIGTSPVDSLLSTALGLVSASAWCWFPVPETYVFASSTLLIAVALGGWAERRRVADGWFVAVSALTFGLTVTNWTAGLAVTWAHHPWRRTLQLTVNAFAVVVILWGVQRQLVPHGDFFIGYSNEQRYLLRREAGGSWPRLRALLLHSQVLPEVQAIAKPGRGRILSVQRAGLARDALGVAGLVTWIGLLVMGAWQAWQERSRPVVRALAGLLAAQVGLYLLYGTETFLYALNVTPLLVVVAALGIRGRHWLRWVAVTCCVTTTLHNGPAVQRAREALLWLEAAADRGIQQVVTDADLRAVGGAVPVDAVGRQAEGAAVEVDEADRRH